MSGKLLSLSEITRRLQAKHDFDRSAVQRYHKAVSELLGAEGSNYPEENLRWWEEIAQARADPKVNLRPENAAAWVELLMLREASKNKGGSPGGIVDGRQSLIDNRPEGWDGSEQHFPPIDPERAERFVVAMEAIAASRPVEIDPLLSAEQAMQESGLSITTLRTLPSVREGRQRKWFRSTLRDCLEERRRALSIVDKR